MSKVLSLPNGLDGLTDTKITTKGSSVFSLRSQARKKEGDIRERELRLIESDKEMFERNKDMTIDELERENKKMKEFCDKERCSYFRQYFINKEIIRQKNQ